MFNFADITRRLKEAGALLQYADAAQMLSQLPSLLADEEGLRRRGCAALAVMDANRGALDALNTAVRRLLGAHS
jgi:3-deoxy-D-manno-octulosonic-acid transferase